MALTDNLQHRWEWDQPLGNFTDSVGGIDLIRQGTEVTSPEGKLGLAADFTTTQTHALANQDPSLGSQDEVSIFCWIKTTDVLPGNKRAWLALAGTGVRLRLSVGATNRVFITHNGPTQSIGGLFGIEGVDNMVPTLWYNIGYTFKRNTAGGAILYQNGKVIAAQDAPDEPTNTMTTPTWSVGAQQVGGERTFAFIDQMLIYDRAVTANEVAQIWNVGAGYLFDSADLNSVQTRDARNLIMQFYPGVVVSAKRVNDFELFDRRTSIEAPPFPGERSQIGPVRGNWASMRAYLDPQNLVLPAVP